MANYKINDSIRYSRPVKMIFSSYGFCSPVMRKKYEKVFRQDEALKKKNCIIIPFAGFNIERTIETEKNGLVEFGFDPLRVVDYDSVAYGTMIIPDFIYVPGGDPFKLLAELRIRNLISKIRKWVFDCESIYIGVSAGAYVAAQNIEYVKQLEDDNVLAKDFNALGLVSNAIVCHSDHYSYLQIKNCEKVAGMSAITIRDEQLVCFKNKALRYIE